MTQTLRPAVIALAPALLAALLVALLLAGRQAPAMPWNPVIDLPGIGITPTSAPAVPHRTQGAAPLVEDTKTGPAVEPVAPGLQPIAPAAPTTVPGAGLGTGPNATAAPVSPIQPPARPVGDHDPWPYPNLPNGKGPLGQ